MKLSKLKLVVAALVTISVLFASCGNNANETPVVGQSVNLENGYYVNETKKVYIHITDSTGNVYVDGEKKGTIHITASYGTIDGWDLGGSGIEYNNYISLTGYYYGNGDKHISVSSASGIGTLKSGDTLTYQTTKPNFTATPDSYETTVTFPNTDGEGEGSAVQIMTAESYIKKGNVTQVKITCTDVAGEWVCAMGSESWDPKKEGSKEYVIKETEFLTAFKTNGIWLGGKKGTTAKVKVELTADNSGNTTGENTGGSGSGDSTGDAGDTGDGNDNTNNNDNNDNTSSSKLAAPTCVKIEDITISWDAVTGASKYYVYYSPNEGFDISTTNHVNISGTSWKFSKDLYANNYMKVVAVDSAGNVGNVSEEVKYSTLPDGYYVSSNTATKKYFNISGTNVDLYIQSEGSYVKKDEWTITFSFTNSDTAVFTCTKTGSNGSTTSGSFKGTYDKLFKKITVTETTNAVTEFVSTSTDNEWTYKASTPNDDD